MPILKRIFSIFILFIVSVGIAAAQHYRASNALIYADSHISADNEILAIGNSGLMTFLNGPDGPGFYRYDVQTEALSKILSTAEPVNWIRKKLIKFGDRAIINIFGSLYLTDGTSAGTSLIGDFGEGSAGGSPGAVFFSNASDIQEAGNVFFFDVSESFKAASVWQSDGSRSGTYEVKSPEGRSFGLLDRSARNESALAFGYDEDRGYSFWRASKGSSQLEFVAAFEGGIERSLNIFHGLNVNAGYVFCRFDIDDNSSLWRLSEEGILTRLAEGCDFEPLHALGNNGREFLYTSDGELWRSDGSTTGSQRLGEDLLSQSSRIGFVCSTSDTVLFSFYSGPNLGFRGVLLVDGTKEGEGIRLFPNKSGIACGDQFVVLSDQRKRMVLDTASGNIVGLYGRARSRGRVRALNAFELFDDIYYSYGSFSERVGDEFVSSDGALIRLKLNAGKFVGYLPPILYTIKD